MPAFHPVKIGVLSETQGVSGASPWVSEEAAKLVASDFEVAVEAGVGEQAGFTDDAYRSAGVVVVATSHIRS